VEKEACRANQMNRAGENILVRGVNWLGDAVMTTPALLRLREAKPHARITIISPEKLSDLWQHHPAVDDVIAITPAETVWQVARRIRWGSFTHGLILPNSPRSALELWLGRVPERIGYARPWRNLLLTQTVPERPGKWAMRKRTVAEIKRLAESEMPPKQPVPERAHQIYDYLHLAASLGSNPEPLAPRISVTEEEIRSFRTRLLKGNDAGSETFFGLNPGAEYGPAKRWPKERFIEAAIALQKETNCRWLIFGGKSDVELGEEIAAGVRLGTASDRITNLAGKTSLRELCIALKLCRVLVTNDTGPAHVAAAVGTSVVIPFGSTSPGLTSPGSPQTVPGRFLISPTPCSPCFVRECPIDFRCMTGITASAVFRAVLDVTKNLPAWM
jgi:heptosyltransferase-2